MDRRLFLLRSAQTAAGVGILRYGTACRPEETPLPAGRVEPGHLPRFFSRFPGPALPARMIGLTGGRGSIVVPGGIAQFTAARPRDSAAWYWADQPLATVNMLFGIKVASADGVRPAAFLELITRRTAPAIERSADHAARQVLRLSAGDFGGPRLVVDYWGKDGERRAWDSATESWVAGGTGMIGNPPYDPGDFVQARIEVDGAGRRVRAFMYSGDGPSTLESGGLKLLLETDWIAFADMRASTDLWLVGGNPLSDAGTCALSIAQVRMNSGARVTGLCNYRANSRDRYRIRAMHGYGPHDRDVEGSRAGLMMVRTDRTTVAIDVGDGSDWDARSVRDKSVRLGSNGMYYAAYAGGHGTGASVGIASARDPEAAWKKYRGNPVLTPVRDMLQAPRLYELLNDPGGVRWILLVGDGLTSATHFRVRLYTTSHETPLTTDWTDQGVILDKGAPDAWDGIAVTNTALVHVDGRYELWYSGLSGEARLRNWGFGRARSTAPAWADIVTALRALVRDPANPYVAKQTGPSTSLTGPVTDSMTIKVADEHGFAVDAPVFLTNANVPDRGMMARVRAVRRGILELYQQVTLGPGGRVRQLDSDGTSLEEVIRADDGGWLFYVTPFGYWRDDADFDAYFENAGVLYSPTLAGRKSWIWTQNPIIFHGFVNDQRCLENPSFAQGPIMAGRPSSGA